jgi:hypothetical protein
VPVPSMHNMHTKAWRYMSFSRFTWLLQRKRIWMARVDKLDDEWELALAGDQLKHVYNTAPIQPLGVHPPKESVEERTKRIVDMWRRETFVSCWCASNHESHALWRIFCGPSEGVVIQSTLADLKHEFQNIPLYDIRYESPGRKKSIPVKLDLATIKRPMFSYENEVRFIAEADHNNPNLNKGEFGFEYGIEPERFIEKIVVHPQADESFRETVMLLVDGLAPTLGNKVEWSEMHEKPPLNEVK